ncbi:MAG: hypothetical protein ACLRL4_10525 [Bifidobacterium bifidum]
MDDSHPIINSIKQMGVDMVDQIQEDAVAHVNEEGLRSIGLRAENGTQACRMRVRGT